MAKVHQYVSRYENTFGCSGTNRIRKSHFLADRNPQLGKNAWHSAPVDLSFLNSPEKPAGKHGFLSVVKDKLVFEDGTPGRFWGTNLTAHALFGMNSREDVRLQARRLSQLGFNLVRFHHHDSFWVNPNIFGEGNTRDTKILSQAMLERLDWWIKCLKDEGIYVWLDLEVQRQLKPGDGIDDFDEISRDKSKMALRASTTSTPASRGDAAFQ